MDPVSIRARLLAPFAALCLCAGSLPAQEAVLPKAVPEDPTEQPAPAPTAASSATPIPPPLLIPPDVLPMPDPSAVPGVPSLPVPTIQQLDEELKPKQLSPAADEYRRKIEWRKLRNQVQNDAIVKAALADTERARNDLEKRKLLARYFNILFDKMIAIGPADMKAYLNDRRREQLGALPQPRVRPTPTPAPTPKPKGTPKPPASVPPPPLPALPSASPLPTAPPAKSP